MSDAADATPAVPDRQVTAREAYAMWRSVPDTVVIVDVRTPAEVLVAGRPPMAWNVPVATQSSQWDSSVGQFRMTLLPDFAARVSQVARLTDTILVMGRSGTRGAIAANLLARAGFTNVYNILDGVDGNGQPLTGWSNSGGPWTHDLAPERTLLSGLP